MTNTPTKETEKVRAAWENVPEEKRVTMFWRTVIGLFIAAVGVFAHRAWPTLPDLVAFGTFGFGVVTASGQYLMRPFKLFAAALRDIFSAIRGTPTGTAP